EIYAAAYNQTPEAADFYNFLKTMEVYQEIIGEDTTLMLSTDSDLFEFFKPKYAGMQVDEVKRLRELERENAELKKMVAEQALDIRMLKDANSRKW
ncbi:MAG: hypothetical protein AAF417_22390, partial [Pseudomonadota bacterium]